MPMQPAMERESPARGLTWRSICNINQILLYVIFPIHEKLDLIIATHPNVVPLSPDTHLLVEREVGTTEAKGDVRNQTLRKSMKFIWQSIQNSLKQDFVWKVADEVGHKYYFATFGIFQMEKHKSWRKSRDPHFSLSYKWETLFNASKKRFISIRFCKVWIYAKHGICFAINNKK